MQSQQLPTESQVLEDEVLPGMENADQLTEEMSERHDHSRNYIGKVRIELCAKSFILQVYDVLARRSRVPRKPCTGRLAAVASFACVHPIRDNLRGNDLNYGTWDYEYNQQLDSQSRVWALEGAAWNHHQSGCS